MTHKSVTVLRLLLASKAEPDFIVADAAGISGPQLSRLADGLVRNPKRDVVSRLAKVFGVEDGLLLRTVTVDHVVRALEAL